MASHFIDTVTNFIIAGIATLGYFGTYFFMLLNACAIPVPSEITLPFSGFAVADGKLNLIGVIIAGTLGDLSGAMLAYYIGYRGGRPLIEKYGKYILMSHHDLNLADKWFAKYGAITTLFARVLPVVRTYISFPAGITKMDFRKFVAFSSIGSLCAVSALVLVGYFMGDNWLAIRERMKPFDNAILIAAAILIIIYIWRHIKHSRKVER